LATRVAVDFEHETDLISIRRILAFAYPNPTDQKIQERLQEIQELNIEDIIPEGETLIRNLRVLGKGCTAIVVLAESNEGRAALKILRTDSGRSSCIHEARILRAANQIGVGPELFQNTRNMLLMELIEGSRISTWISNRLSEGRSNLLPSLLRSILEDCHRLDRAGIDHGELNPASKHIIVNRRGEPTILDFESASMKRRVSNVTSASQYLFVSSEISGMVRETLGLNREGIIKSLKEYSRDMTPRNLQELFMKWKISESNSSLVSRFLCGGE